MKLYYMILAELKDLPDEYGYKFLSREATRFRMKVVDENMQVRAIEDKISAGLIEELIFQAHNELKLLKIVKNWKPWNFLGQETQDEQAELEAMLNFRRGNPFPVTFDRYDNAKHTPAERRPSAAVHPEDQ